MSNYNDFDPVIPDFVAEAEAAIAAGEAFAPEEKQEVTIKFGKGLVGEPFTSKNGKELVEVKIPNTDPADYRPWESFVISPKMIHENKFGKGLWMKLPANESTRLSRSVNAGKDESGKNIWKKEFRVVSNTELKAMLESYKTRESVLGKLSEKKEAVADAPKKDAKAKSKTKSKTNDMSL